MPDDTNDEAGRHLDDDDKTHSDAGDSADQPEQLDQPDQPGQAEQAEAAREASPTPTAGSDQGQRQGRGTSSEEPFEMVDWDLAVITAKRLMKPGPDVTRDEARRVVSELRRVATESEEHVRDYTGLHAESASAPVLVVDRGGWVQANADGFKQVLRPLLAKMREKKGDPGAMSVAIGSRVTGLEAGGLLAYLS